jgi:hypothetical protein
MQHSMNDQRSAAVLQSRPARSTLRLALTACLVGAILPWLSIGPALGQEAASGAPDPQAWSEWRQQHLELEYPKGPGVPAVPDSATVASWVQDHFELENQDAQGD